MKLKFKLHFLILIFLQLSFPILADRLKTPGLLQKSGNFNNQIADDIKEISSKLNRGESKCYQEIENIFRLGINQEWTGKCK